MADRPGLFVHITDQIGAMFEDMAPMLFQFYSALLKQGFTEQQALQLTETALTVLIERGKRLSAERASGE